MHPALYKLVLFSLFWLIVIYLLNCLIATQLKRIQLRAAIVYFMATALIGLFGEIFLDTFYTFYAGHPLWYYNILPIYNG